MYSAFAGIWRRTACALVSIVSVDVPLTPKLSPFASLSPLAVRRRPSRPLSGLHHDTSPAMATDNGEDGRPTGPKLLADDLDQVGAAPDGAPVDGHDHVAAFDD